MNTTPFSQLARQELLARSMMADYDIKVQLKAQELGIKSIQIQDITIFEGPPDKLDQMTDWLLTHKPSPEEPKDD